MTLCQLSLGLRVSWLNFRELFRALHPPNTLEITLTPKSLKGVIDPEEAARVSQLAGVDLEKKTSYLHF